MAPGETGPLSTASDVSAVQYPPAVPTNTEHQGLSRGSTGVPAMGGGGSGGVGDSGLSVVFEDLSDVRPSRKGVYVQVGWQGILAIIDSTYETGSACRTLPLVVALLLHWERCGIQLRPAITCL
jgi:hypothetical protein